MIYLPEKDFDAHLFWNRLPPEDKQDDDEVPWTDDDEGQYYLRYYESGIGAGAGGC